MIVTVPIHSAMVALPVRPAGRGPGSSGQGLTKEARLADGRRLSVTTLASGTPMTRPAVGRHLRVLEEAGLLVAERSGRETRYALERGRLAQAATWIAEVAAQWDDNLARLQAHLAAEGD